MNITVKGLTCILEGTKIIQDINLEINNGEFVGIVGPNGSGKSTLLKNLYRTLKPDEGIVFLNNKNLFGMSHQETAKSLAVFCQETTVTFDFTVAEIVYMGRHPHKKLFTPDTPEDAAIVEDALQKVGMANFARRSFITLSGGEKQRVLIARALAQQAKVLILDEPTNHLDIRYQLQILELIKRLDITVLAAVHDLNIAALYCDKICVLHDGKVAAFGTPDEVLRPNIIGKIFGVKAEVSLHKVTGRPVVTYLPEAL